MLASILTSRETGESRGKSGEKRGLRMTLLVAPCRTMLLSQPPRGAHRDIDEAVGLGVAGELLGHGVPAEFAAKAD